MLTELEIDAHLPAKAVSWCPAVHPFGCLTQTAGKTLTEVEIDEHLTAQRAAQPGFIEPSFPTIAGEPLASRVLYVNLPVTRGSAARRGCMDPSCLPP